jgi:two-component sensor histidine kinase
MAAGRMAVWEFDVPGGRLVMSDELYRLLGYPEGATPTAEEIRAGYVAEDWERLGAAGRAALARGSYLLESELRHRGPDGMLRTLLVRLEMLRDDAGQVVKGHGVLVDITERKSAETNLRTVVNELNHRVKNTLTTVQSMVRQSLRDPADPKAAWHDLSDRIVAFAAAHDLITEHSWNGADLEALVSRAVASAPPSQVSVEGPPVRLSPKLALSLSLALHELLTNAYKHGALSAPGGRVAVTWSDTRDGGRGLQLRWVETGGPPPPATPARTGFGSRLLMTALPSDLSGRVVLDFPPTGAVCLIEAPLPEG